MEKALNFKIWGNYAHFKKYYTTTSPLTFEFPPPTSLIGILSAIIGLDKQEYLNFFQNEDEFKIAIKIESPVKKVRWTQNLIDTKKHFWNIKQRTQIRTEFLKEPSFAIYFWHKDKERIYNPLKDKLSKHLTFYSISLGLSELLADYKFLGEIGMDKVVESDFNYINSVVPANYLLEKDAIDFEQDKEIFNVNYPVIMKTDREVIKRENVFFERNGNSIRCKTKQYWQASNGEKIVFF